MTAETASGLSYKDRKQGEVGRYGVFRKESCFMTGFNINACSPNDPACIALVPCVSAANQTSCYALISAGDAEVTTEPPTTSTIP